MPSNWKLIAGGTVIDATGADPFRADVLIRDDRIHAVGEGAARDRVPTGEPLDVVDAEGNYVMPGLIDVHCHMTYGESQSQEEQDLYTSVESRTLRSAWHLRKVLRAGFTSISQPGGSWNIGVAIRDAVKAGMVPGPRMTSAGRYITTSNGLTDWYPDSVGVPDGSIGFLANSIPDMMDAVRRQVKAGVDLIKLSDSAYGEFQAFTGDELKAIADLAHQLRRKVTIHARGEAEVDAAVAAGIDWIMHANVMSDDVIERLAASGIPIVPTLLLPTNWGYYGHLVGTPARMRDGVRRMLDETGDTLHRAHEAGVKMVVGTDTGFAVTPFGEWHARELELLMEYAGLSAMEAIQAATVNAAPMVNLAGEVGEVVAGQLADLLVVADDPLRDIRVLQEPRHLRVIMKGGVVVANESSEFVESWPYEPHKVQSTGTLTRALVAGEPGRPDGGFSFEEGKDLFAAIRDLAAERELADAVEPAT